jgi:hypothetical protein
MIYLEKRVEAQHRKNDKLTSLNKKYDIIQAVQEENIKKKELVSKDENKAIDRIN